jgi:hypothetical protein
MSRTRRYVLGQVISPQNLTIVPRLIRMAVPPIPVFSLLFMFGVRVFDVVPVIVRQVHSPCVTLMVVPVVIIVVTRVIDADLNARFLRRRRAHQ